MTDPYFRKRAVAAAIREKRMGAVDFSLPVDGDLPAFRNHVAIAGELMDRLVDDIVREQYPFFDEVREKWNKMFPDLKARPGKWVPASASKGGKLFLRVNSAAASFALRPKLPMIKKRLAALATAPGRFSLHVEIATGIA